MGNTRTQVCRCGESTVAPPAGGHHSWCPFYAPALQSASEFFEFKPDYEKVLGRIADTLDEIRKELRMLRRKQT